MSTQSTHTQRTAQRRYVPGSSQKPRSAVTLLAQVADLERGERIKARRLEMYLTQPGLVDAIEELAKKLPRSHRLHPSCTEGRAPVSLRGLQTWEAGGGIDYEKAKLLAQALQMDVRVLLHGEVPESTPDPFADQDTNVISEQLAAIHRALEEASREREQHAEQIQALLKRQDGILKNIEDSITAEKTAKAEAEESRRQLLEAVDVARRIYADAALREEAEHGTRAT